VTKQDLILARARSAIGQGIHYALGCGGYRPDDPLPCRRSIRRIRRKGLPVLALFCDCSGFVSWVVGLSRRTTIYKGRWGISTVSIYRDALGPGRYFHLLGPGEVQPGDFAVYPDRFDPVARKTVQGHVAVVTDYEGRRVIDCGASSDGITERIATFWPRCIFVRYIGP
jgi:hypothetical protein